MKVIGTALYHPYEDSPIKESRINSSTRVEFKTNFSIKRGKLCVSGTEPIVLQGFFHIYHNCLKIHKLHEKLLTSKYLL